MYIYIDFDVFDNISHSSYANYDPTCVSAVLTPFNQYLPFILVIEVGGDVLAMKISGCRLREAQIS